MSGVWDSMLASEAVDMGVIREDHGAAEQIAEDIAWRNAQGSFGVSFKQGFRNGWWQAIPYILQLQMRFNDLTESESLHELRLGSASVYWPLLHEQRVLRFDCPTCGHQVTVDVRGICDECGWEVDR